MTHQNQDPIAVTSFLRATKPTLILPCSAQKICKKSFKFQNPFRQNYKHVKALQALLPDLPQKLFQSIVVMLGECEWRSKQAPKLLFTSGWKAADHIRDASSNTSVIDVQSVSERLQLARLARGLKTDLEHVQNLQRNHRT